MPQRPAYSRIADEIADDIRSGRLAPGSRVPSTRQIVRDHGVAMATASKVLAALRAAGLVEAVPGSGTVVRDAADGPAPAPRPAASARPDLTRAEIVEAAVRIADADGLPLVTMRRVAAALGVSTMALYRHVPSRDDLTLRMADSVFAGVRVPDLPDDGWRLRLETVAGLFWTTFGRHSWACELISLSRPQLLPHVMPLAELSLGTLRSMGFDATEVLCAHVTLFGHVRSMALARLAEERAESDTGVSADDWVRDHADGLRQWQERPGAPGLRYVMQQGVDFDLDTVYRYGLQRLLDGLDARRRALGA